MIPLRPAESSRISTPHPRQKVGTLGEMLASIVRSLQLASELDTSAAEQWDRARRECARTWQRSKNV